MKRALFMSLLLAAVCRAESFDPKAADFDTLLFHAQRYGNTSNKIERKIQAEEELLARGADSLRFLMGKAHLENMTVQLLAFRLVEMLPASNSATVLAEFVGSELERTRRVAAYFLGFCDAPQYASQLMPLLDDSECAGAAMRTLGKWKHVQAVANITPFLSHEREVRRVVAANALRDIGDPAAIPALVAALSDPVFTVREAAARALSTMGVPAEKALLRELPKAGPQVQRHIIRTLGAMKSRRAKSALKRLAKDTDPWVARDAQEALKTSF